MGKREKAEARAKRRRNRLIKKTAVWFVVLGALTGVIFYFAGTSGEVANESTSGSVIPEVTAEDWIKWNPDASVTMVEYSDFQCPACASYYPLLNAVGQEYGDKVRFVYRHYPLTQIHFNAESAARVAEAAGRQGKFWEMHDMLFKSQELWSSLGSEDAIAVFGGYAKNFEDFNLDQYLADFKSDEVRDAVAEDYTGGLKAGVNATPTFYVNGEKIRNPSDIEGFRQILDEALANAEPAT